MAIFIASDIHGTTYGERLDDPALAGLTKEDYLIVCGDLEMIDIDEELRAGNIAKLEAMPYTTLFIDGNHEEYEVLERYPVETWNGGKVRRISDSVLFLMRGQVFELEGRTFFVMGGAPTFHKARLLGLIEGPDPGVPSEAEKAEAEANLAKRNWKVDFVLTHAAPTGIVTQIPERKKVFPTSVGDWLEDLSHKLEFEHWLFGHYHCDHEIDGRFRCLFNMIYEVETGSLLREPQRDDTVQNGYLAIAKRREAESDWAGYARALVGTPLFLGVDEGDVAALLEALKPKVHFGDAHPVAEGGAVDRFYLIVSSDAADEKRAPRFTYGLPDVGQPGSITGAIPTFSCKDRHLKRTPLSAKEPYPDATCKALVMSPGMLTGDYGPDVARTQLKVLRNMAGILAQKAVDARRILYVSKSGIDIYCAEHSADGLEGRWA